MLPVIFSLSSLKKAPRTPLSGSTRPSATRSGLPQCHSRVTRSLLITQPFGQRQSPAQHRMSSSAGATNQHESSSNSSKGPEVVEEQSETDAMGLGAGAVAGAILVGGAAAVAGAPFVIAGAALGALAGGIAGGAMGSEVSRGVELDDVMDQAHTDTHHHHGKPHLPHLGGHRSAATAADATAGAQQVPGASQPPHPDELQRQDHMVAPEKDVAAAQAVAETATGSAGGASNNADGKIYDIGGHPHVL